MPKKRHTTEEIIGKLREVEVLVGRGGSLGEAIRGIGVTEQTCYRWRKEFRSEERRVGKECRSRWSPYH